MSGTLHQIAQELATALERLEKGDLQLEEVGPLTDQARELYERLVALRYMAIERLVKPTEGKEGGFRLNDIHPNQTSLIDAIEEVSKHEDVKKQPQVIQEQLFAPSFEEVEEEEPVIQEPVEETTQPEEPPFFEEEEPELIEEELLQEEVPDEKPEVEEPEVTAAESKHALQQDEDDSLAQKLRKTPIDDLRKAIGLNQKFLLINELFGGDADTYNASVDQLNGASNHTEAANWIDSELKGQFEWDNESTTVQEFLDLVERRFL